LRRFLGRVKPLRRYAGRLARGRILAAAAANSSSCTSLQLIEQALAAARKRAADSSRFIMAINQLQVLDQGLGAESLRAASINAAFSASWSSGT